MGVGECMSQDFILTLALDGCKNEQFPLPLQPQSSYLSHGSVLVGNFIFQHGTDGDKLLWILLVLCLQFLQRLNNHHVRLAKHPQDLQEFVVIYACTHTQTHACIHTHECEDAHRCPTQNDFHLLSKIKCVRSHLNRFSL